MRGRLRAHGLLLSARIRVTQLTIMTTWTKLALTAPIIFRLPSNACFNASIWSSSCLDVNKILEFVIRTVYMMHICRDLHVRTLYWLTRVRTYHSNAVKKFPRWRRRPLRSIRRIVDIITNCRNADHLLVLVRLR